MRDKQQDTEKTIKRVADYIRNADVILIAAGAGMSVDGGIADYYGGIHLAHPRLAKMGLNIYDLSNHSLFEQNPALAWGHWINRQREYMNTRPHLGYHILHSWNESNDNNNRDVRVITTNLDRHFLRSGFTVDQVFEMHGSMYDAQCMAKCGVHPWSLDLEQMPPVDLNTMLLRGPTPVCMQCHSPARVCTSLAVDGHWYAPHVQLARIRHETFFQQLSTEQTITVLEIGCGTVMNKLRTEATRIVTEHRMRGGCAAHIRINLHEAHIDEHQDNMSLSLGALQALNAINKLI